jgi:hypothetical protein
LKPAPHPLPLRRCIIGAFLGAAIVLTAALLVIFWFDPSRHGFYPKCLLHSLTGWNCAGCGSLRALHQVLHGDFLLAFRSNALLVLMLLATAGIGIGWLRGKWSAPDLGKRFFRPATALGFLGIAIIFSVLRNLPLAACAWMNP